MLRILIADHHGIIRLGMRLEAQPCCLRERGSASRRRIELITRAAGIVPTQSETVQFGDSIHLEFAHFLFVNL
jgi:hypothetical protein